MAVKSIVDLQTELSVDITDNTEKLNTAARVRNIIGDFIDSAVNRITDAAILGLKSFSVTTSYSVGDAMLYDAGSGYAVYRCTTAHLGAYNAAHFAAVNAIVGSAGGDLSGSYPNPTVSKINGVAYNADPLQQYVLLNGRAGGQGVFGGDSAGENLTLHSNSTATPGIISIGSLVVVDDATGHLGINVVDPISWISNTNTDIVGSDTTGLTDSRHAIAWVQDSVGDIGFVAALYNGSAGSFANGLLVKTAGTAIENTILECSTSVTQDTAGSPAFRVLGNGSVIIGAGTQGVSSALTINSTTGALLVPRMTTTQKNSLTAVNGMIVYDSTLNKFQGYQAGSWQNMI